MKSVFFGGSEYVIPILETLKDRFGLAYVFTTDKEGPVINFAKQNKIPYESVSSLQNTKYKIQNTKADIGITAFFGTFIKSDILNLFDRGILGLHPSLLPKHRGPTPVQTAILNGDDKTGITIFKMDEKLDHGPTLSSEEFEISSDETTHSLHTSLFKVGANLLEKTLIDYIEEVLEPVPQNEKTATFTKKLAKEDGRLDLETLKIGNLKLKIERAVRAFYPWPGVWFRAGLKGKQTVIKLLPNQMIQAEGKKPQSFKDFVNGYTEGKDILNKLKLD